MTFARPLCAQFVGSPPIRYKHHLALIVVVDKENYTHIAMQTLLANERSEDFEFLFRVFRELIGGAQPQVSKVSMCSIHGGTRGPQKMLWLCCPQEDVGSCERCHSYYRVVHVSHIVSLSRP